MMNFVRNLLERWTESKDDKTIAWTLGIGWACCGGAMAGGSLVFAKACVRLLSVTLEHRNDGNLFANAGAIATVVFLALTAIFQIICLNHGLRVYDSTLVVPVFYGVYTASGFINSLVFNNEVDAYQPWTLFLIALSIIVLIGGVVLLTSKKPEPKPNKPTKSRGSLTKERRKLSGAKGTEGEALASNDENPEVQDVIWGIGDDESDSDDDDNDHVERHARHGSEEDDDDDSERGHLVSKAAKPGRSSLGNEGSNGSNFDEEFGPWEGVQSRGQNIAMKSSKQ
jgi:hypothetical protein